MSDLSNDLKYRLWVSRMIVAAAHRGDLPRWFASAVRHRSFAPTREEDCFPSRRPSNSEAAVREYIALTAIVDPTEFAPVYGSAVSQVGLFNYLVVVEAALHLTNTVRQSLSSYPVIGTMPTPVEVALSEVANKLPEYAPATKTVEERL